MTDRRKAQGPASLNELLKSIRGDDPADRFLQKAIDPISVRKDMGIDKQMKAMCEHKSCLPSYNHEEAQKLKDAWEIRQRFPRFWGTCPDCGDEVICYASYEHYIMGDW